MEPSKPSNETNNVSVTSQKLSSARLPVLKSTGPDSNYSDWVDWELVVYAYLDAAGLGYV
ncbi:hypothetical protein VP01_1889g2, partial [Puccinia sorghi]